MKAIEIAEKIKSLNLPLGKYAVVGGSVLAMHNIRESEDIDLIVKPEVYEQLKNLKKWKEVIRSNGSKVLLNNEFDVGIDWTMGDYSPDVSNLISEAEIIEGVPCLRLEEIATWKKAFGREKDIKDVQMIEEYLRHPDRTQ